VYLTSSSLFKKDSEEFELLGCAVRREHDVSEEYIVSFFTVKALTQLDTSRNRTDTASADILLDEPSILKIEEIFYSETSYSLRT
jgi:hypothetical protein